ncbi:SRPBCC family protein [Lysobacter sp. ESA13C]|uniref:SRPBCC family protein n=1 Tax=Lysobacter sp. ESA13C TaxID=2862676 RepID=UPI001CBE0FDC|nr:SRPBCC family protein [Lysobacter sp. ESA13C]
MNLSPTHDDYGTVTAADTVRIERLLPGPIDRVWAYLTESDKRRRWLAAGDMELRLGGAVELVFNNDRLTRDDDPPPAKYAQYGGEHREHGQITAFDPPHLLSYTWSDVPPSEVRFELAEEGERVRLVVTHSRLADRAMMISVAGGWHTHLGILVALLSGEQPQGFWRTHTRVEAEYERRIPSA